MSDPSERSAARLRPHPLTRLALPLNARLYCETIWVLGDGRSGASWLGGALACARGLRECFEPIHPGYIPGLRPFGFHPYLQPGDADGPLPRLLARIFAGRLHNDRVQGPNRRLLYRGLLVKDVFGHLLVPWVHAALPRVRRVLVLRHPFAVACSKRRLGQRRWMSDPRELLERPGLRRELDARRVAALEAASGWLEKQVALWCLLHRIALDAPADGRAAVVHFEDLCIRTSDTLVGLYRFLGWPAGGALTPDRVVAELRRRGPVGDGDTPVDPDERRLGGWLGELSAAEVEAGLRILEAFGLGGLYGRDPLPLPGGR